MFISRCDTRNFKEPHILLSVAIDSSKLISESTRFNKMQLFIRPAYFYLIGSMLVWINGDEFIPIDLQFRLYQQQAASTVQRRKNKHTN